MHRTLRSTLAAVLACVAGTAAHAVPDTLAQRLLACTACHGDEDVVTAHGYFPRIAGKPAGYLYNQLINFRDGRRRNDVMADLIAQMDDAYLREIANHFAALEVRHTPPPAPPPLSAADQQRAETLIEQGDASRNLPACVSCHGPALTGVEPAVPGLLGLPSGYLLAQFGAWRQGLRQAATPDCMAQISERLSPQDISALARHLASQPLPADARPATRFVQPLPLPLPLPCGSVPR